MMTATHVETIPSIARTEARERARTEYARVADQLRSLTADDWTKPTDCELWDVRAMAGHTLGMMSDFTGFGSMVRRMRASAKAAKATGAEMLDCMTSGQVADNAGLSTAELITRIDAVGPKAAAWRTKQRRLFRSMPMKQDVDGTVETWRMAYLLDIILTRDPWMHRVDTARATGCELVLTPEHDGRIVADVVAEWARRHGKPFELTLTGPAGGHFIAGSGGESHELDAAEFCRTLSGRGSGDGLLTQAVPF
jgi:uncharacterized protein (TIGR03083 family)